MMKLKQASALLLSAALLTSLLAGCGKPKDDPVMDAVGYSQDTVFATIGKEKITAGEYLIWVTNSIDYMNGFYQMNGMDGINWDEDTGDGTTARDFIKAQSMEQVKLFWAIESTAKAEGITLDDKDKTSYQEQRTAAIEQMGGEAEYNVYLKSICMSEEMMERVTNVDVLSQKLEEALCREGGRFEGNKDSVRTYMEEQGILKSKHILYATKDTALDSAPYSEAKIAEQKQRADAALAQIRAAADPVATFNQIMNDQSEDPGLEGNPDGYLFSTNPDGVNFTNRMVTEFEEGTKALAYNAVSDVIQSEHGYHIILRLDPVENEETYNQYLDQWYGAQMDTLYQEKLDSADLKTTEAYNNFNPEEFFTKLTEYRAELQKTLPAEDATTPPEGQDGTTAPEGGTSDTPADGDGNPPAEGTPPATDDTAPTDDTATPPADTTTPPADTTTPPADSTTPPADGQTPPQ